MIKLILSFAFLLLVSFNLQAQKADGTIGSIVKTELEFNNDVQKKGINKAFSKYIDKDGVTFKPNLIKLEEHYSGKEIIGFHYLNWQPQYGMISKKGDLGFITGPFNFSDGDVKDNGHYLSIWKNVYGKWKLALQISINHPLLENNLKPEFHNPTNFRYTQLLGPKKIQMREDIVFSTDVLLGKSVKMSKNNNLAEFYDTKAKFYFPENIPLISKKDILDFVNKQKLIFQDSAPSYVDRALSGDLAYTYGEATISQKKYNYVRVWKLSDDMKWNIIVDFYNLKKDS